MYLRFKRAAPGGGLPAKLHDPPALEGGPGVFDSAIGELYLGFDHVGHSADIIRSILSVPKILTDVLPSFIPYAAVVSLFAAFVKWNGGIVLGTGNGYFFQELFTTSD